MIGALNTYSQFYYVGSVTVDNCYLDFKEGSDTRVAQVQVGSYTITKLLQMVASAMNDVGTNTYSLSVDRSTRIVTITSSGSFDYLGSTGNNVGRSILSLLGLPLVDHLAVTSVAGTSACGTCYRPQFWLQNFMPTSLNSKAAQATVSKSASGKVSVQKFGIERFMKCNIMWITDIAQPSNSYIETNSNGVQNALDFMEHLRTKAPLEFMFDRDDPNTFERFILESTPEASDGTGYELKEKYDVGLPFYFETGNLKFRLMDGA